MPFMKGLAPIRRTVQYLEGGQIILRNCVQILTINYNVKGVDPYQSVAGPKHIDPHKGVREFIFWHLPQIQYKNPNVQILTFRNLTPTPFIRCYLDNGQQVLMDIFGKSKEEIHDHLKKILGKTQEILSAERIAKEDNPANFGAGCIHHCMCELPGQVPCSAIVPLPKMMRGKYVKNPPEE